MKIAAKIKEQSTRKIAFIFLRNSTKSLALRNIQLLVGWLVTCRFDNIRIMINVSRKLQYTVHRITIAIAVSYERWAIPFSVQTRGFPEDAVALFIEGYYFRSPPGYSYIDANGILQTVSYTADDQNGFRVSASNLPQSPKDELQTIQDTAEVAAAKRNHLEELQRSQQANWQDQNLLSYKILPSYFSLAQIQPEAKAELNSNARDTEVSLPRLSENTLQSDSVALQ